MTTSPAGFPNPFRPGAGHAPPYLAGREVERDEFRRLLEQTAVFENFVLTGLRGVGKTVLLETLRPIAHEKGWRWAGADLSEAASATESNLAVRLCADLALITGGLSRRRPAPRAIGFASGPAESEEPLSFERLLAIYDETPGLAVDKFKSVIRAAWNVIAAADAARGIVFAYDEAQNLRDHPDQREFPLSLLLDAFQSLQRQDLPVLLVVSGLPTLFPQMVEARTFAERMFRVCFLDRLSDAECVDAIQKPIEDAACPLRLGSESVEQIVRMSSGYPYFVQFICREVFDAFLLRLEQGQTPAVPAREIEAKLDTDFFAGRWSRLTDRQRDLLRVAAGREEPDSEFAVRELAERSKQMLEKPFSPSHIHQMLGAFAARGLVFRNRYGRYSFAVPLFGRFIRRQPAS